MPAVGTGFTAMHTFTAEEIRTFARFIGDQNPLHHDAEAAAASRFGELIASGTHTTSVMMGLVASWSARQRDTVGLGYAVRLRRPVPAGVTCTITWNLVSVEYNAKLRGTVIQLEGQLLLPDGKPAVMATTDALVLDEPPPL